MKRALALLLACTPACAPVVTHGPRVEQGFTFYGTGGGTRSLCGRPVCDTTLVPQHGAGVRYGRAATASRPGWSAGLTASTALVSSELDLYVQAPRSLGLDVGAGVLAAGSHAMPYVQAGHMRPDGSGLYTTQGFAFLASRSARWSVYGGPGEERVEPATGPPPSPIEPAAGTACTSMCRARSEPPMPRSTGARSRGFIPCASR